VTRASLREHAVKQRERYQGATRAEKHRLLDEVVAVTGIHRKGPSGCSAAHRGPGPGRGPAAARGAYGPEVAAAGELI
jgi:hypothetical protein